MHQKIRVAGGMNSCIADCSSAFMLPLEFAFALTTGSSKLFAD